MEQTRFSQPFRIRALRFPQETAPDAPVPMDDAVLVSARAQRMQLDAAGHRRTEIAIRIEPAPAFGARGHEQFRVLQQASDESTQADLLVRHLDQPIAPHQPGFDRDEIKAVDLPPHIVETDDLLCIPEKTDGVEPHLVTGPPGLVLPRCKTFT